MKSCVTPRLICLIPGFDGASLSSESKDALWAKFTIGAHCDGSRITVDDCLETLCDRLADDQLVAIDASPRRPRTP